MVGDNRVQDFVNELEGCGIAWNWDENKVIGRKVIVSERILPPPLIGRYYENNIYLSPGLPTAFRRLVLAHELGHAFGLHHSENPCSIMYPVLERGGCQHDDEAWEEYRVQICGTTEEMT